MGPCRGWPTNAADWRLDRWRHCLRGRSRPHRNCKQFLPPEDIFFATGKANLRSVNLVLFLSIYGTGGDADDRQRGRPLVHPRVRTRFASSLLKYPRGVWGADSPPSVGFRSCFSAPRQRHCLRICLKGRRVLMWSWGVDFFPCAGFHAQHLHRPSLTARCVCAGHRPRPPAL